VTELRETAEKLNKYGQEFDERTFERHEMGAQKYGPIAFLDVDSLEMAIEEVLDLSNYVRYTYIKLRMLQDNLPTILADKSTNAPLPGMEMLGKDALQKGVGL
jgi:hypothetical protein